jgi:hypothetical protein
VGHVPRVDLGVEKHPTLLQPLRARLCQDKRGPCMQSVDPWDGVRRKEAVLIKLNQSGEQHAAAH